MNDTGRKRTVRGGGAALVVALTLGCGGGGGGGGGAGGAATVAGNVSNATTSALERSQRGWLAWLGEEIVGLARRAYAAVNTSLGGITVTVTRDTASVSGTTDNAGDFTVVAAPSGNVSIAFSRDSCTVAVALNDVEDNSTIDLQDTTVSCNSASPGRIQETFQGVLHHKPASGSNGNFQMCALGNGSNHIREMDVSGAVLVGGPTSADDLLEGDLLTVTGLRRGVGGNSTIDATRIELIGGGENDQCQGIPTPTPEPSPTPTETP